MVMTVPRYVNRLSRSGLDRSRRAAAAKMRAMTTRASPTPRSHGSAARRSAVATALLAAAWLAAGTASAQVYRWVDDEGVIHLSSEKPPPGVKAERLELPGTTKRSSSTASSSSSARPAGGSAAPPPPASPQQTAAREDLLGQLRTRECVIALEALDRKTSGAEPTSASEIRRLEQTADANCSSDPARRARQEEMAAQLRVANSPSCVEARNRLADMMTAGASTPRDALKAQQTYVDEHCTPPVR
jgi:hypothetical protein